MMKGKFNEKEKEIPDSTDRIVFTRNDAVQNRFSEAETAYFRFMLLEN